MSGVAISAGYAVLAALAGTLVGWLHFRSLRAVTERLVAGQLSAVALQMARIAALALFLYVCARFGAVPLLTGAAGIMAGRAIVLRRPDRSPS
ncbi:MAG: hypothetical protein CL814_09755 [Confluentimicrobium sp.]|jgi:hypothetical protein|uniref:N-ATPase subunit AtpR n=1 Tax=Actibacterium sp. TaxID=1872125 RepID=UPI000C5D0010|nr:ATP synthase subunit I [Actibacterium sp.]MBC57211.1 hypothetical protein [Actibacterium sp.]|tara:strand:+ start:1807 stop:2085 length:279 start_codon:yes stop_codon:yes gene_type:complete